MSWRRITYALVLVFASLALLELWFGPFFAARSMGTEAGVVPTSLVDSTVATAPTSRVKRHSVSFEVPRTETERSKGASASGMLAFTNGLGVYVSDPPKQMKNLEFVRGLRGIRAAALRYELGRETLGSEFAFASAAIGTTRSDAKWWRSPIYNNMVEFLLTEKMVEEPAFFDRPFPIYMVHFGNIRGFQMGDPQGTQDNVKLILFDEMDHECRIDLIHTPMDVTQPEISALVASLQLEPDK